MEIGGPALSPSNAGHLIVWAGERTEETDKDGLVREPHEELDTAEDVGVFCKLPRATPNIT
jgi:hypothetical protein